MKQVFLESHNIKNQYFGFGQFNYHLIKGLHQAKVNDFKITLHAKDLKSLQTEFGPYFNYKKYFSFRRHPLFQIRKKYDLWHCLNQNIKIEPRFDIPYLLTVHDVNFIEEESGELALKRRLNFQNKLNRSHAITYISNYAKTSTHQHFKVPDVPEYVIYNGNPIKDNVLPDTYKPKLVSNLPYFYSIGEFTKRKNFHTLVEMLKFLPGFNLVLSGNNNTDYAKNNLTKILKKLSLEKRVLITGKVEDIDKQYYLKHCTAFVFPSLREGFGIPPIEAMSFGKPIFLSNNTSLPEIGGEHAFYWDNYDPEYMANIVIDGLDRYNDNTSFYLETYIKRSASFNWNEAAKQYIKVYRNLLFSKQ